MTHSRIHIYLSLDDRTRLENILACKNSSRYEKIKAEALLLSDESDQGPKVKFREVLGKLGISIRSLSRIKETYAKNSSIDDLFKFPGLSDQRIVSDSTISHKENKKYIEDTDVSSEEFLDNRMKCRVTLTNDEREYLEAVIREGKQSSRKFNRAKLLLLADEGSGGPALSDDQIANKINVSLSTVARVRRLFVTKKSPGEVLTFHHNKAGRLPKIDGTVEAFLVAQVCSRPPDGRCRWTVRLLADRLVEMGVVSAISHTAVATTLKKMNLSLGSEKNG